MADYKYLNNGGFIQGVPARDLTQDEWDALEDWQRQAALKSGLYMIVTKKEKGENGISK